MKKKTEVVGKADNEEQTIKEQTVNEIIILNKDANIREHQNRGRSKKRRGIEQYGKPNQQCQKHQKVIADESKTKEKEKENQGDGTSEEDKNRKNTSKTSKPETKHSKLHQENLEDKKVEHKLNNKLNTTTRR